MKKNVILCVDDEKIVLDSLKKELRQSFFKDYKIEIAESGSEAIELLCSLIEQNYNVPVVIVDYLMPIMKGDEVLQQIKKTSPKTYCIMLTGMATIVGIVNAINKAGLYRFIGKPWETGDIILTVEEALKSYEKDIALAQRQLDLEYANEKLLKLDTAKNYFLGLLSHELNTPLIGINGNAKLISQLTEDPDIIECTEMILDSEARLRKFAEMSLLITRIQTDKYYLKYDKEFLKEIINTSLYRAKDKFDSKKIEIILQLSENDYFINADTSLITKVFDFVLENSLKYSKENSKVNIKGYKENDEYILNIIDEGHGFSSESLDNMFQFFKSTDSLMSHSEGTGLSLAAAKIIMEMHNFKIKAFNSEQGGAIIQLIFNNQKINK